MTWLLLTVIPALLWAIVNHTDKYLIEKYCKNSSVGALILFSCFVGFPVVLISNLFIDQLFILPFQDIIILILSGALYLGGIIFYLYALQIDDTSTVAPQMLLGPMFTYILSFLILKESLTVTQFVACILVVIAAFGLNYSPVNFTFNIKSFAYMCVYGIFIALSVICYKFVAIDIDFWTSILWSHVGFIIVGFALFTFVKTYRHDFIEMLFSNGSGIISINIISEIINIVGNIIFYRATLLAPIVFVQTITEGIQPVFVLLLGIILTVVFPKFANEDLSRPVLIKNAVFTFILAFGVFLTLY